MSEKWLKMYVKEENGLYYIYDEADNGILTWREVETSFYYFLRINNFEQVAGYLKLLSKDQPQNMYEWYSKMITFSSLEKAEEFIEQYMAIFLMERLLCKYTLSE